MTRIVLVRHGETVWHAENRYAGVSDIALTARGFEQAKELAAWAKTAGLAAVWASPLSRARLTALACAEAVGTDLRIDERLRELDFGSGEGHTFAEMHERFPKALRAFRIDPVADHLPGGEDPAAAARRFTGCLHDLADRHDPEDRVLVVAHSTAIRLALCELIGIRLGDYRRIFPSLRNCGLTEIRLSGRDVALLEFNTPIGRVRPDQQDQQDQQDQRGTQEGGAE
jgi:broad specificity phosphatase PhoE